MNLPIRVALVDLAPLVRDIVHDLVASASDMRVAAVIDGSASPDAVVREVVDVYLVGVGPDDVASTCERLLGEAQSPRRVIGVSPDGRQMHVSELRPATAAMGSLSSDELLDVIRGGARQSLVK
jgi:DNA-binding NarL/FixJ family response regulator